MNMPVETLADPLAEHARSMIAHLGEDPERDAQRFRRTASGVCLITQTMIDRLVSDEPALAAAGGK